MLLVKSSLDLMQEDFRWGQGIDQVAFYLVPRARSERT
jgi:hypothetical protein